MERPFRREVTSPAPLSCARWKERVVGGTPTRWLISPAARPAGPRRTRRRNTFSRDSWASAPRAATARFSSIVPIYWNYSYLSRVVVVLVGVVVRVVALPALPRRRIVLLARLGITGHRRATSSWAYHGRPPPQERAQRGPRPDVAGGRPRTTREAPMLAASSSRPGDSAGKRRASTVATAKAFIVWPDGKENASGGCTRK